MNACNPYAPPQADLDSLPDDCSCWRKGKSAILRRGHALPGHCVKCNTPVAAPAGTFRLQWRHPIYGLFNRHIRIGIPLCPQHDRHFRRYRIIARVFMAGAFLGLLGCLWMPQHEMNAGPAVLAMLICGFFATILHPFSVPLKAHRIDSKFVHLRGCDKRFLGTLPEYPYR